MKVSSKFVKQPAHNLLTQAAIGRNFLALRTTKFLCASAEGFVEVVLLLRTSLRVVGIHIELGFGVLVYFVWEASDGVLSN